MAQEKLYRHISSLITSCRVPNVGYAFALKINNIEIQIFYSKKLRHFLNTNWIEDQEIRNREHKKMVYQKPCDSCLLCVCDCDIAVESGEAAGIRRGR
jgi:hypothetical protein